jgi:hypothetical protein
MMNTHLSTTSTELIARLNKDWDGDVKAFDAVYDHILDMSDALADGIVKQFPDKFGTGVVSVLLAVPEQVSWLPVLGRPEIRPRHAKALQLTAKQ